MRTCTTIAQISTSIRREAATMNQLGSLA
jgi:hypothetical protein